MTGFIKQLSKNALSVLGKIHTFNYSNGKVSGHHRESQRGDFAAD